MTLHRNAQRLLRPLLVVNPYAPRLRFLGQPDPDAAGPPQIPDADPGRRPAAPAPAASARSPRHHGQPVAYIEVTPPGHRARQLASPTRCWAAPWTSCRRRPGACWASSTSWCAGGQEEQGLARADVRFTRREVREASGWEGADTQLKVHLGRLVELEYLLVHRGGRGQSFVYELL